MARPFKGFWQCVRKTREGDHWIWTAWCARKNYPMFRSKSARRISWLLQNGSLPKLHPLVSCGKEKCIKHLYLSRHNGAKGGSKIGRQQSPGKCKLDWSIVNFIRNFEYMPYRVTLKMLSEKYGVSREHMCRIVSKRSWNPRIKPLRWVAR